jgi:predicted transcriptional regulator
VARTPSSAKSVRLEQPLGDTVVAAQEKQQQEQPQWQRARAPALHQQIHLCGKVLRRGRLCRNLRAMEVHFTPEQEAQLSQIAAKAGTDAERLVKDAALRLLQEDARFRAAVREGIAQADRGEFIGEEEMDARLEQMLGS